MLIDNETFAQLVREVYTPESLAKRLDIDWPHPMDTDPPAYG